MPTVETLSETLLRPVVFTRPQRLVHPPGWIPHVPFAFWLVDVLRPRTFVELGTQSGNSYAAIAQAIQILALDSACYSVDTWKGDHQSGLYGEDVFEEWSRFHDLHFGTFSRLVRSTFDEALSKFEDGTIDLLHIDGLHTYDAVRHDFESWLPKLSNRAVVLFHDTNVREGDFGVWQLWEEIRRSYSSFSFLHGHGLGIAAVGRHVPEPARSMIEQLGGDGERLQITRRFFAALGDALEGERQIARRVDEAQALVRQVHEKDAESARLRAEHAELQRALAERSDEARTVGLAHATLEARLESETATRVQLETALSAEREQVAQAHATLETRLQSETARRVQLETALSAEREQVALLEGQHTQVERAAAALQRRLDDVCRELEDERDRAGLDQKEVSSLRAITATLQANLENVSAQRKVLERELMLARDAVDQLEARNVTLTASQAELAREIETIHTSKSWRWTAPLRDARRNWSRQSGGSAAAKTWTPPVVEPIRQALGPTARESAPPLPPAPAAKASAPALPAVREPTIQERLVLEPPAPVRLHVSGRAAKADRNARTIICLTHVVSAFPRAGNEYRIHRMLTRLRDRGYRIVVIAAPLPGDSLTDDQLDAIAAAYGNAVACDRNGRVRFRLHECPDVLSALNGEQTADYAGTLRESTSLAARQAELLSIDRMFCHDVAIAALLRLQSSLKPCSVLAQYIWMSRALPLIDRDVLTVIDTHDLFSAKREKVEAFGIASWDVTPDDEAGRLARARIVIAIQEEEARSLASLAPASTVVTTGVDFDPVPSARWPDQPQAFSVGSDNPMNLRGIRDFLQFAWPEILRAVPDARLAVAGGQGRAIPQGTRGVEVLGHVEDLDACYDRARVVINPAAAGTGLKVKTVEALNHLRPVVAWPNGFDGLPSDIIALLRPAEDWLEFAGRVAEGLRAPASPFDARSAEVIRRSLSADHVYADLEACLASFFERETARQVS